MCCCIPWCARRGRLGATRKKRGAARRPEGREVRGVGQSSFLQQPLVRPCLRWNASALSRSALSSFAGTHAHVQASVRAACVVRARTMSRHEKFVARGRGLPESSQRLHKCFAQCSSSANSMSSSVAHCADVEGCGAAPVVSPCAGTDVVELQQQHRWAPWRRVIQPCFEHSTVAELFLHPFLLLPTSCQVSLSYVRTDSATGTRVGSERQTIRPFGLREVENWSSGGPVTLVDTTVGERSASRVRR